MAAKEEPQEEKVETPQDSQEENKSE
jgi:hypothetical protein